MSGLAIECATGRVDIVVRGADGSERGRSVEDVENGHTRRVTALVAAALEKAGASPMELTWIAADLGPGSFTGVRVGLATAAALSLASGARVIGASSLTSLALTARARRALIVPLVPAGRTESYAGFYHADPRATVRLLAAPRVVTLDRLGPAIEECRRAVGATSIRVLGPGVPRWHAELESFDLDPVAEAGRWQGLRANDLADAALSGAGPAAGLPGPGAELQPLYVRSAQAEERVRHRVRAADPPTIRALDAADLPAITAIEERVFSDPWPASFFLGELSHPFVWARVAEHGGSLAGYSVALLGGGTGHLGNLAVAPEARRRGIAAALLADLLDEARARGVSQIGLEVRVSNFAAQDLYRAHGFGLAGVRRNYYRDTGEDALLMGWESR